MSKSLQLLLASWSDELFARVDRVRSLIGDAHWATDGAHKESLLRTFIASRLPSTVAAGHGFLLDSATDACSREIDVLIRDCLHSAPLFDESGITICHPQSISAYIEVKSDFRADSLENALKLVSDTQKLVCASADAPNVWRGICFTGESSGRSDESLFETLVGKLTETCDSLTVAAAASVDYLPICILCLNRFCAFIGRGQGNSRCRLRYFATERLSFAVGMADMLSHVYARAGVLASQPLDESVERAVRVVPMSKEI